jgi:hypothetical protein
MPQRGGRLNILDMIKAKSGPLKGEFCYLVGASAQARANGWHFGSG